MSVSDISEVKMQEFAPKPVQETKWKSLLPKRHKAFFKWLEKSYPKEADKLKKVGNGDPDKFKKVSDSLKDCSQVYVVQIGDTPAAKLKEIGIEPCFALHHICSKVFGVIARARC